MKNIQKISFILLSLAVFSFTSCNKNDNETPEPKPTTAELLMGSWLTTKIEVRSDGVTTDATSFLDPCEVDDLMIFEKDGVFKFDEGATKCDDADPQTTTGSWKLISNDKKITITEDGVPQKLTIIRVNNTELQMSIVEDFTGNGENDIITVTMTKE